MYSKLPKAGVSLDTGTRGLRLGNTVHGIDVRARLERCRAELSKTLPAWTGGAPATAAYMHSQIFFWKIYHVCILSTSERLILY